jgi:branched-chain amino acid transport system ATP-binding protein
VEQHVEMTLELVDYAYVLELGHVAVQGSSSDLMTNSRVREAYLSLR